MAKKVIKQTVNTKKTINIGKRAPKKKVEKQEVTIKKKSTKKVNQKPQIEKKTVDKDVEIPIPSTTRKKPLRNKNSERKFIRIEANAPREEYNKMGLKVQNGEIIWSHYAIDNDIGYHYYLIK